MTRKRKEFRSRRSAHFLSPDEQLATVNSTLVIGGTVESTSRFTNVPVQLPDATIYLKMPQNANAFHATYGVRPDAIWKFDEASGSLIAYDVDKNVPLTASAQNSFMNFGVSYEPVYTGDLSVQFSASTVSTVPRLADNMQILRVNTGSFMFYGVVSFTGTDNTQNFGPLVAKGAFPFGNAGFYITFNQNGSTRHMSGVMSDGSTEYVAADKTQWNFMEQGRLHPFLFLVNRLTHKTYVVPPNGLESTGTVPSNLNANNTTAFTVGSPPDQSFDAAVGRIHYLAFATGSQVDSVDVHNWMSIAWSGS